MVCLIFETTFIPAVPIVLTLGYIHNKKMHKVKLRTNLISASTCGVLLQVSWTRGIANKGQCDLHVTPDDLLLLVCVSQGAQRSDKWGEAGQGDAEGGVYLVRESARGQGPLALELVHTIVTTSPSHLHMW